MLPLFVMTAFGFDTRPRTEPRNQRVDDHRLFDFHWVAVVSNEAASYPDVRVMQSIKGGLGTFQCPGTVKVGEVFTTVGRIVVGLERDMPAWAKDCNWDATPGVVAMYFPEVVDEGQFRIWPAVAGGAARAAALHREVALHKCFPEALGNTASLCGSFMNTVLHEIEGGDEYDLEMVLHFPLGRPWEHTILFVARRDLVTKALVERRTSYGSRFEPDIVVDVFDRLVAPKMAEWLEDMRREALEYVGALGVAQVGELGQRERVLTFCSIDRFEAQAAKRNCQTDPVARHKVAREKATCAAWVRMLTRYLDDVVAAAHEDDEEVDEVEEDVEVVVTFEDWLAAIGDPVPDGWYVYA